MGKRGKRKVGRRIRPENKLFDNIKVIRECMTRFVRQILVIHDSAYTLVERMTIGEGEERRLQKRRENAYLLSSCIMKKDAFPSTFTTTPSWIFQPTISSPPALNASPFNNPIKRGRGMNHSKKLESVFSRLLEVRADWSRQSYLANLDGEMIEHGTVCLEGSGF